MAFGKLVEVDPVTRDRYGRIVAWVHVGGRCLNEEILRAGYAWHFKRSSATSTWPNSNCRPVPPVRSLGGSGTGRSREFRKARSGIRPSLQTASASR